MAQDKLEAHLLEMGLKASLNEQVSGRRGKAQRALEDALKAAGKQRLKVRGDGDCQFGLLVRAQRQMGWESPNRGTLKTLIRDWIEIHKEHYKVFVEPESGKPMDQFLVDLGVPGAAGGKWGNDTTLQAFCDWTGFAVRVWDVFEGAFRHADKLPNESICKQWKSDEPLVVLQVCTIRGLHYDCVVNVEALLKEEVESEPEMQKKRGGPGKLGHVF